MAPICRPYDAADAYLPGMALRRTRVRGRPTSANGASSFHLWWQPSPPPARMVEVDVEIVQPPGTADLVFWALQISFADGSLRRGGAHVGLQWHRAHPGGTAVNWGGYRDGGGELDGTESSLPSATHNPNTRDYPWRAERVYTLSVEPGHATGWWQASITDQTTGVRDVLRELQGGGNMLVAPVVWSEVFAPCDAPSSAVRWSGPRLELLSGGHWQPSSFLVSYQTVADGGCSNTDVEVDGTGAIQRTSTDRRVAAGAIIPIK